MAEYDNNNTGVLSKNENATEDWHAPYRGKATIDGVDYYIDAHIRTRNSDGSKFFSLKFKSKGAPAKPATAQPKKALAEMDDDLPF